MKLIAKLLNLLLILPISLSNCDCTFQHELRTDQWGVGRYYSVFRTVADRIIKCVNISLDGSTPLRTFIQASDAEDIKFADAIHIVNSSLVVIERGIFDSFDNIPNITLDNDNIVDIKEDSFANIMLRSIKINNNPLTNIRANVFHNLLRFESLELHHNMINTLENINDISYLKYLNVSHNQLRNIKNVSFDKMKDLEVLDLSRNFIEEIDPKKFTILPNLRQLYLRDNLITSFKIDKFVNPFSKLDLSMNFINTIEINSKENFILYNLDYSDNNIEILQDSQFANLDKLSTLLLDKNMIKEIDVDAFKNLYNLTILSLSDNHISSLYSGTFHELSVLVSLNISWNGLESLPSGIFTGLNNLEILDLSENRLHSLSQHNFYPLRYLKELYLHGNAFGTISPEIFTVYLKNLKHLSLTFKNVGCSYVGYTLKRLQNNEIKIKQGHQVKTHNIHGIACEPDIKEIDHHEDYYEKQLLETFSYFPMIEALLIVLVVISIVFLVMKSLSFCNIDLDYVRKRFFRSKPPATSLD